MIEVRDKKNHDRLLGYIPMRPMPFARVLEFPICRPIQGCSYQGDYLDCRSNSPIRATIKLEIIDRAEATVYADTWTHTVVHHYCLDTEAPLEDLRCIPGWQFPGDDKRPPRR